ncbi:glycerophosphodiester phosphodiesterase [Salinicoccus roseus]|uniref:glycerophosphodiester phosphodiesterase n=1 Tax=Salinicoccus roseus TaxID=45670 RepID=UPI003566ABE6
MKKCTKTLLTAIGVTGGLIGGLWVGTKVTSEPAIRDIKPYFRHRSPYIFAHRGGMGLAPEHTAAAFDKAGKFDVDGFEIDIRMTKDEEIVVFHDAYVDRTSNGAGRVSDMTLAELRDLDFGYHFRDAEGSHPYRGSEDAKIMTLRELLEKYPDKLINIDIKDDPNSYEGSLIPSLLYRLIDELGVEDRVLVTSFYDSQIDRFHLYSGEDIALGAGENQVRNAYIAYTSGFKHMFSPKADTFQIPPRYNNIPLDKEGFIDYLQSLNVAVGYWVINEMDEMDELIQKGAHTIVTDYPDISHHLMKERY